MGKRGKPKRIIRCAKPAKCPECGNRKFLIVVYGMPTQKVWDDTGRYDCRGSVSYTHLTLPTSPKV